MRLPRSLAEAIVAHARAERPNEACGLVVGSALAADGGEARRYVPCRNQLGSPSRYLVHRDDLLAVLAEIDRTGEELWAVVHSHVRTPAVPSRSDVGEAAWPAAVYLLVSLADEAGETVREAGTRRRPPAARLEGRRRRGPRAGAPDRGGRGVSGRVAWVLAGIAALVAGTLAGWNGTLIEAIARPPALVRAALVAVASLTALRLLAEAIRRIDAGRRVEPGTAEARDLVGLIRGVRLVFLAVAAASAAAGWLLGSPLPLVAALVIAGVDVLETGLLLLVVSARGDRAPG